MTTTRSVQRELDNLRKEIAGLRQDYSKLKGRARASTNDGVERFSAIKDDLADTIDAIKSKLSNSTGAAADEISSHIDDLRNLIGDYSDRTEKTVAAHPIATVAGALAIGWLIGRLNR